MITAIDKNINYSSLNPKPIRVLSRSSNLPKEDTRKYSPAIFSQATVSNISSSQTVYAVIVINITF
jgi:hypothetical protein